MSQPVDVSKQRGGLSATLDVASASKPFGSLLSNLPRYKHAALAFALGLVILQAAPVLGVTTAVWQPAVVVGLTAFLWVSRLLPSVQTNTLTWLWVVIGGAAPLSLASHTLLHPSTGFVAISLILGGCLASLKLEPLLHYHLLRQSQGSVTKLGLGLFVLSLLGSFVLQEHLVVALVFSVTLGLTSLLSTEDTTKTQSSNAKAFLLTSAVWGSVIGGIGTYLGGGRGLLANSLLVEATGTGFGFWEWALWGIPMALGLGVLSFGMLVAWFKPWESSLAQQPTAETSPPLSKQQGIVLGWLGLLIMLWLTTADWLAPVLTGGLVLLGLLASRQIYLTTLLKNTPWKIILTYGTALLLGQLLLHSQLIQTVLPPFHQAIASLGEPAVLLVSIIGTGLFTELLSNAAAVSALLPGALQLSANPPLMTLAVALSSGLAFLLPTGTPATALLLSEEGVNWKALVGPAIAIKLLGWLVLAVVLLGSGSLASGFLGN